MDQFFQILKNFPWGSIVIQVSQQLLQWISKPVQQGLYEVLEYESTLELKDALGVRAQFTKRQRVRYLQDNIIAYQDQAWGDGKILIDYRCTPGQAVDQYRFGHKTMILISLREVKQRGSMDEFHIQWKVKDGFLRSDEQWETEISHPTRWVKINVIFPRGRNPKKVTLVESDQQKSWPLAPNDIQALPDGRWKVTWSTDQPHLNERYVLKWSW